MSNGTNEKIQNTVWDTDWAQGDETTCKASHFYEPENAWTHAYLPNDEAAAVAAVNVFAFEPIDLRPPGRGRRYVYIWNCCQCGKHGIGIMVECCPDCGIQRCGSCQTEKVRIQ